MIENALKKFKLMKDLMEEVVDSKEIWYILMGSSVKKVIVMENAVRKNVLTKYMLVVNDVRENIVRTNILMVNAVMGNAVKKFIVIENAVLE